MTDRYEQGFKDAVEQAAQQICIRCQKSWKLENRETFAPEGSRIVYPCQQSPDGSGWSPCSAGNIRLLTPGAWVWRQFLLSPETMAALFHEIHGRLAPKFGYKIREDRYTAETQVNRYRTALEYIATHTKDRNTVDDAILALAEGERLPVWDPAPWDRASESNRNLTIAVCGEILAKVGQKESQADSQS